MTPLLSIFIPCYNHGAFIREALDSIIKNPGYEFEIIIVNDGSTDPHTIQVLNELNNEGYNVIHQDNQGLGRTRNNAIKIASGQYILPLDADNRLLPAYCLKGVEYLQNHPEVAVAYADPVYF